MESKSSKYIISKIYDQDKLTIVFTVSSIILAIQSLNGHQRYRNQFTNDDLPQQTKKTFNNIQNFYKYLKSNIDLPQIVSLKSPGRIIVTYVYQQDSEIKSKYLTYNLQKRKPKVPIKEENSQEIKLQNSNSKLIQVSQIKKQQLKIKAKKQQSMIKIQKEKEQKGDHLLAVQIISLAQQNQNLKKMISNLEAKHNSDIQNLQRKFDKKLIQVYQLIEDHQQRMGSDYEKIKIPGNIKLKKQQEKSMNDERMQYLILQIESIQNHPLIKSFNCVIKITKNGIKMGKNIVDKAFNRIKPLIQKLQPRANKVIYYGMLGFAQIFAIIIALITIRYLIWPVIDFFF